MAQEIFEYADFSGGDYGRSEAWRAPKNTFSATNMLVYRTGELGVRPGVRLTNPTGLSNGAIWGIGQRPLTPGDIWFGQGTAIKHFTPQTTPGAVSTASGSLTGTPSGRVAIDENGTTTYIITPNANGYSFNGASITNLTNMPNGAAIALYGDRLAIVPASAASTVQFSAAASYNNWTISAGNAVSVTVGDTDPITALLAQRGHLAVLKKGSSLYVVTGTPGTNEALRPVYRFDGPVAQWGAGRTRADDRIWFAPTNAQPIVAFDGTNVQTFDNFPLSLYTNVADRSVVTLKDDDQAGAAFVVNANAGQGSANEVWLRYRGAWTRHTFGVGITNYATAAFHGYAQDGDASVSRLRYGTMLVFSDGGAAGATPNFWAWQPFIDRPGQEADPFAASAERAGDASATPVSGSVTLPEQRMKNGQEIQVTGVIVDFRSWNTGGSTNNHFDLTADTLNTYEASAPVSSATASFDEAPGASPLAGAVRSKYFSFGDQGRGGAFQLKLANVRGVAFQRFRVVTETFPPRGL